jgi:hypothetical protein
VIQLYGGYSPDLPSAGWLLTDLKSNGGIRLTPYEFSTLTVTGDSIVDTATLRGQYPQAILTARLGQCVYVVGQHPTSTQDKPVATLTQWYSKSSKATPQKVDQVSLALLLAFVICC